MLYWTFVFFVLSVISAVLGFGGLAAASAGIAQVLFYIFLGLFVLSLISNILKGVDQSVGSKLE